MADVLVSRELKSLQEELSASKQQRAAVTAAPDAAPAAAATAEPAKETPEQTELLEQLRQFANELTGAFDEAEKTISTHPTQSVAAAFLVGMLVGRLLPRR